MDLNSVSLALGSHFKPSPFTSLTAHIKKDSASQLSLMWQGQRQHAGASTLAKSMEKETAIIPALRPLAQLLHSPGNSRVPWVIFFYGHCRVLFILLHFCLLFLLLAHKQCGQFHFTCLGISDSSPASVALSGYTVKCLANKMHKAEIGKSMPLLEHFTIFHAVCQAGLPAGAGARDATQGVCHQATCQLAPEAVPFAPCPPGAGASQGSLADALLVPELEAACWKKEVIPGS